MLFGTTQRVEHLNGKAHVWIADFWFKLVAYSAATALMFKGADQKSDDAIMVGAAFISLAMFVIWIQGHSNRLVMYFFPDVDPEITGNRSLKLYLALFPLTLCISLGITYFATTLISYMPFINGNG